MNGMTIVVNTSPLTATPIPTTNPSIINNNVTFVNNTTNVLNIVWPCPKDLTTTCLGQYLSLMPGATTFALTATVGTTFSVYVRDTGVLVSKFTVTSVNPMQFSIR